MEARQARADQYSGEVAEAMRDTMRASGCSEDALRLTDPVSVSEIARLSEHAGVPPSRWFPPTQAS